MTEQNIDNFVRTEVPFKTREMTTTDGKMWSLYTQGMAEREIHDKEFPHLYYDMEKLPVIKYCPSGIIGDTAFKINTDYTAYKEIILLPREITSSSLEIYGQLKPIQLYPETFSDILEYSSSVYFEGLNTLIIKDTLPYPIIQYMRVNIDYGKLVLKPQNVLQYDVDNNAWSFTTHKDSELDYDVLAYGIKEKTMV